MDKTTLEGKVYNVPDFDLYDDDGNKIYDGSNIYALICDRRWFKIKEKDMFMDEFYNANNRSWQNYLNVIKVFNYSLFANALMLVASVPTINITSASFNETNPTVEEEDHITLSLTTVPFNATETVTFASNNAKATVSKVDDRHVTVTGSNAGTAKITASANNASIASVDVTVTATNA